MMFFTGSKNEVRKSMIRCGGTAVEVAGSFHTDFPRRFIQAEVMACDDSIRRTSQRDFKAHNPRRQKHKGARVEGQESRAKQVTKHSDACRSTLAPLLAQPSVFFFATFFLAGFFLAAFFGAAFFFFFLVGPFAARSASKTTA